MASSFPHRSYFLAFNHVCCLMLANLLGSHLSETSMAEAVHSPSWTHWGSGVWWAITSISGLDIKQLGLSDAISGTCPEDKEAISETRSNCFEDSIKFPQSSWTQENDRRKELDFVFHIQTLLFPLFLTYIISPLPFFKLGSMGLNRNLLVLPPYTE